ncbi:unnamed protein product [Gadus morhua 'NCC']
MIESIQRSFTAKIAGCSNLSYWDRLKHLNLYSLQRRRERYMVILVWKIYHGAIPNSVNLVFQHSERRGVTCQQCLEVWVAAQVIVECSPTVTLSVRVTSLGLRSAIPMGEGTRRYRQSECRLLFS